MEVLQSEKVVIASMVIMLIIVLYDQLAGSGGESGVPTYETVFALGVLFVVLSFLADVSPQIAGPFAFLILIGVVTARVAGVNLITKLSHPNPKLPATGAAIPLPTGAPGSGAGTQPTTHGPGKRPA